MNTWINSFPPGYRFNPQDEELILHYLKKKVLGEELPMNKIVEVNLYRHDPDTLAAMYRKCGEENENSIWKEILGDPVGVARLRIWFRSQLNSSYACL
ncbi:unnamed protein product [Linum trigynum]|uniref:NAC domain-containing protein n=1 Tax=Linum trigynum TaxID=586398 RepID=A0AAV2GF23_9ROSI